MNVSEKITTSITVGNMLCECCTRLLTLLLEKEGVEVIKANRGEVKISYDSKKISIEAIESIIEKNGFTVIKEKEEQLFVRLKAAVIELVHYTTYNAMVRNSDFLVEKFNKSYQYLSALFSKYEGETLEKFIIRQKIERVKILLSEGDLTLSEIAYMMGYSSVQYLSTQFKNITGVTVTRFKKEPGKYLK